MNCWIKYVRFYQKNNITIIIMFQFIIYTIIIIIIFHFILYYLNIDIIQLYNHNVKTTNPIAEPIIEVVDENNIKNIPLNKPLDEEKTELCTNYIKDLEQCLNELKQT